MSINSVASGVVRSSVHPALKKGHKVSQTASDTVSFSTVSKELDQKWKALKSAEKAQIQRGSHPKSRKQREADKRRTMALENARNEFDAAVASRFAQKFQFEFNKEYADAKKGSALETKLGAINRGIVAELDKTRKPSQYASDFILKGSKLGYEDDIALHVGVSIPSLNRNRRRFIDGYSLRGEAAENALKEAKAVSKSDVPVVHFEDSTNIAGERFPGSNHKTAHAFAIVSRLGGSATHAGTLPNWYRATIFDKNLGQDINATNKKGQTALHIASNAPVELGWPYSDSYEEFRTIPRNLRLTGVKPLLRLGADPFIEDKAGKNAFYYMAQTNAFATRERVKNRDFRLDMIPEYQFPSIQREAARQVSKALPFHNVPASEI